MVAYVRVYGVATYLLDVLEQVTDAALPAVVLDEAVECGRFDLSSVLGHSRVRLRQRYQVLLEREK